ncbi:MAG TPA: Hsp20/alpha crystallin family protein [Usitatibacter sp.]|jgi:HSP20 family protein|nr:Hsp20/alpha crystallin family protein [Usitatibacter sp.]
MMTLTRYQPLTGSLDRVLDELFRPALWQAPAAGLSTFRVDVRQDENAYTVFAELPGVKKDAIHVEIHGDEVAITAETKREAAKEGSTWLAAERRPGKVQRRIVLPHELDESAAEARFVDGVLELTLPRKAAQAVKRIEVR